MDLFAELMRGGDPAPDKHGRREPVPAAVLLAADECLDVLLGRDIGGTITAQGLGDHYPELAQGPVQCEPEALAATAYHLYRQCYENPGKEVEEVSREHKREGLQGMIRVLRFCVEHFAPHNVDQPRLGLARMSTNPSVWLSRAEIENFLRENQFPMDVLWSREEMEGERDLLLKKLRDGTPS